MSDDRNKQEKVRVIMWCAPRSASTILAKCLSAIKGMVVWLEPYVYADGLRQYHLRDTQEELPMEYEGNEELYVETLERNKQIFQNCKMYPERFSLINIKRDLEAATDDYVFVKDMGATIIRQPSYIPYIPDGFKHTFLIRDPSRVYVSFRKGLISTLQDLGTASKETPVDMIRDDPFNAKPFTFFKGLHELWTYVRENLDPHPIVIDTYDLLSKPDQTLKAYCEAVGLPFSESLLKWNPSVDESKGWRVPGDGLLDSMKDFYGTAMASTHFMAPRESGPIPRDQLTDDVIRCVDESMPYYTEMYETRLRV